MANGTDVDVVVVGAGVSGLAAADRLVRAGRSVLVQEAGRRIGGRLLTRRSAAGHPVDLGATWFWPGEERVAALASELALPVHPQHLAGDAVYHDPRGRIRLDGNPIDVPSGRFSSGAAALADGLAARLPDGTVRLDDPVLAVEVRVVEDDGAADGPGDTGTESLVVTTASGSIRTSDVVLALPPAVAVDRIEFRPALPQRLAGLAAATPVWMGSVAKVVALYERPFWRDRGLAGSAVSHLGPLGEIHDMSGPDGDPAALFGFARLRTATEPVPDRETIEAQLALLFGPEAPAPIELLVVDWRQELGPSAPGQVASTAYQLFGNARYHEPALGGRLHWASTETVVDSAGHIEGALAGAERATAAILAAGVADRPTSHPRVTTAADTANETGAGSAIGTAPNASTRSNP
ncbi:MAG: FAD-dependent oxidoreductase [Actinomycetota bacterium]